jgi:RNA polymerase sigma-70 factor (ECF subfamily)
MDDAELVRQVLQHNRGAFGELVTRYTAQIAALCRAHVPRQEVEDLVQETFFRALDRLSTLREPDRFGSWLYAIARNVCRDWLNDPENQYKVRTTRVPYTVGSASDGSSPSEDRLADLKACIRHLPVPMREVIEIYYGGDRVTYQELADRLEVSFSMVNKLLTEARKLLRNCLEGVAPPTSLPA